MLHLMYKPNYSSYLIYNSKIRCMDLSTFIQNNLALLERYLLSANS